MKFGPSKSMPRRRALDGQFWPKADLEQSLTHLSHARWRSPPLTGIFRKPQHSVREMP
jgi:hypothetical protein